MKKLLLSFLILLLSGCFATGEDYGDPQKPQSWTAYQSENIDITDVQNLRAWWQKFNDPVLNELVGIMLTDSPDRKIAEARILEARGIRRTEKSFLFPEVNVSGNVNREDSGFVGPDNYFDARFDASYEIDVFGKNRKALNAADATLRAREAEYHDITLSLAAEIARAYIEFRAYQKQVQIAEKNLEIQEKTLELIEMQKELGEVPQLDVERAKNLVNTTRSSIPDFRRIADNARLQLTVLTGRLPEQLKSMLENETPIPGADVQPVLTAPADILTFRPDVRAARALFEAGTASAESATADIFPSITLSGFYGMTEGAFSPSETVWNITLGAAMALLDFGRIEGRIDAARAAEKQAYEQYRKTVLEAVTEVEMALNDYAHINEQRLSLNEAYDNAERAFELSQVSYREGEVSFIDVLDAQRVLNDADSSLINTEAAQAQSLVRLHKSLGIY